jgi:hypothetical protein
MVSFDNKRRTISSLQDQTIGGPDDYGMMAKSFSALSKALEEGPA